MKGRRLRGLGIPLPSLPEWLGRLREFKRRADSRFGVASRFTQFCLVGTGGMVVDLLAFRLFLAFAWPMEVGRAFAIWIAMTCNFWLNRSLTFAGRRADPAASQYVRFVLTCSLGALISWSVSVGLVRGMGFFSSRPLHAAVAGVAAGTGVNFVASLMWAFRAARR